MSHDGCSINTLLSSVKHGYEDWSGDASRSELRYGPGELRFVLMFPCAADMAESYTSRGDTVREMFEFEIACQGLSGLTGEYADAVFAAGARDVSALLTLTPEFVGAALPTIPSPRFKPIAEAGRTAARAFCVKFGSVDQSGASGETASSSGDMAARLGVPATSTRSRAIAARGGVTAAQMGAQVAPRANATTRSGVGHLIAELRKRANSSAVTGFETEWHAAAADALSRLEAELKVDVCQFYSGQCSAGKELLLRELHRKTGGMLAHRKRKHKIRK